MPPLIEAKGLAKSFTLSRGLAAAKTLKAVNGVDIAVAQSEILGVVGESGCGKSTLARLLLRLIEPSAGDVRFSGESLLAMPPAELRRTRRFMQMVFQDPYSSLDPRYTIGATLLEAFAIHGIALSRFGKREKAIELLERVGLTGDFAGVHPHELSGGQRQRVGIARAMALDPRFVVLDEPTAALDVSVQAQIIELLSRLRDRLNLSYVFISHNIALVRYFCDRVAVMYLGRIVEILDTRDFTPRHHYTAALISSVFQPDPQAAHVIEPISGDPPSAIDLPPGCAFAARCPAASDRCRREVPVLAASGAGEAIACFHPR